MRASVWKESESGTRYEMYYEMPMGRQWYFHAWMKSGVLWLDGSRQDGYLYLEERPGASATNTRVIGKHFEYDYALNRQIKRYYADGVLLATRLTVFNCPPTGTCEELTYVQGDHLGSSSTLTNGIGNVVARERYSAFGERRKGETYLVTDQLYTGQRLNVLSNLYHYSDGTSAGRFYDPLLGRFVQADPTTPTLPDAEPTPYGLASGTTSTSGMRAGQSHAASSNDDALKEGTESSGFSTRSASLSSNQALGEVRSHGGPAGRGSQKVDPQHLNRFSYVRNNPLRYIDPSGYWTLSVSLGGTAFAMLGARGDLFQLAIDGHGNVGLLAGLGGGAFAGGGAIGGFSFQATTLDSVNDLKEWSVQLGAVVGDVVGGQGEIVFFKNGVGIAGGLGKPVLELFPVAPYTTAEYSWLLGQRNIFDEIDRIRGVK